MMHFIISEYRWLAISLLLLTFLTTKVFANPWSIEIQKWNATQFENSRQIDSAAIERGRFSISYDWSHEHADTNLSYGYQPVLIRSGNPAHNGYFHRLDLGFRLHQGATQIEFTSGIHGSSNMYKHFDFHNEALVSIFSIMRTMSSDAVQIGINGDYRFGHFRLYPRVYISKVLSKAGELTMDFPVALIWRKHHWQFGITRYGEKWAALDSEREFDSAFYLNEWRLGGRWQVPVSKTKVAFELGAGISFNTRIDYLDLVRGWQEKDLESAVFIDLGMKF